MHSSTVLAIVLAAAGAQASLHRRLANQTYDEVQDYINEVCYGVGPDAYEDENFVPDFDLPCYAVAYIEQECLYGSVSAQQLWNTTGNSTSNSTDYYGDDQAEASPRDQQICLCQSQYFNALDGCYDCFNGHGLLKFLDDPNDLPAPSAISSFSSSYCQATVTPTLGIDDALESAFPEASSAYSYNPTASYSSDLLPTYSFTDPIGNKTDVTLYFTPSVTGSAAYAFSEASPTGSLSSRAHLFTSSTTSGSSTSATGSSSSPSTTTFATNSAGQIVATAGQSGSAAASSAKPGAAVATAAADKFALAGVFGIAAVVAYL